MKLGVLCVAFFALAAFVQASGFVSRSGIDFVENGVKKWYSGTNNYYAANGNQGATKADEVLQIVAENKLEILRVFAFNYATFANGGFTLNTAMINSDLDYALQQAAAGGFRLIMPLTDNWGDCDTWVSEFGGQYHDQFFSDATIVNQFKSYVSQLIAHVNSITGVAYKNDPSIFAWELINEPRCGGSGLASSGSCTVSTISSWIDEMSKYIKSLDGNHMVCIGDEGFGIPDVSSPATGNYIYTNGAGMNFQQNLELSAIDFGTFHMYPDTWGLDVSSAYSGTEWMLTHFNVGNSVGKPVILEEFGLISKTNRPSFYNTWYQTCYDNNVCGAILFWETADTDYPDYDGFTLYPSDISSLIDPWTTQFLAKSGGSSGNPTTTTKTTTTTTTKAATGTTSTKTTTTASSGGGSCGAAYAQCGGVSFSGPTCCVSGYTCNYSNQYYSQCVPGGGGGGVTTTTTTTTTKSSAPATTTQSGCGSKYAQCGGIGFNGPTCCTGSTCTYSNSYYSQCL